MGVIFFPTTKNLDTGKSTENKDVLFLQLWMKFSVKYTFLYISQGEKSSWEVKVRCAAATFVSNINNIIFSSLSFPFR